MIGGILVLLISGAFGLSVLFIEGPSNTVGPIAAMAPGLFMGPILILAGINLRTLSSKGAAMVGAIAAVLPFSAGWFVTLPIGIWAIVSINRKEVNRGFSIVARQRREARHSDSGQVRYSRKAILGAIMIGCALLTAPMFLMTTVSHSSDVSRGSSGPTVAMGLLMIPILLPGLLSPIGSTVLGLVALNDIRSSNGRIRGRLLAFFDAMFFPVIILNLTIGAVVFRYFITPLMAPQEAILLIAATFVVANIILIRQVWRNVNR